jgi:hypothetical protein
MVRRASLTNPARADGVRASLSINSAADQAHPVQPAQENKTKSMT